MKHKANTPYFATRLSSHLWILYFISFLVSKWLFVAIKKNSLLKNYTLYIKAVLEPTENFASSNRIIFFCFFSYITCHKYQHSYKVLFFFIFQYG